MNTLLIITGAGASHDVADPREINVRADFRPPLTEFLFTGGTGQNIKSVNQFLIDNFTAAQVGKDWRKDRQSLEGYLLGLKNSKSFMLRKRYWAVPIYLHDLFLRISNTYIESAATAIPSNYSSLITAIANNGNYEQVTWLNLNYDLLADFAIKQATNNGLKAFNDYMKLETLDKIKIKYTKPHGSVDWFRRFKESIPWVEIRKGNAPDNFEKYLSTEIYTHNSELPNRLSGKEFKLYPAILAPLGEYDYVYKNHIDVIKSDLDKISKLSLLCIGFRAKDQDILDLIKDFVDNVKSLSKIKIVNGNAEEGKNAYLNISRCCGRIRTESEKAVFNGGFTKFINEAIDEWL